MLFELDNVSFQISTHSLKNHLPYVTHTNHIFIKSMPYPQGSFKNSTQNSLVCFKSNGMIDFKLSILKGMYCNVILESCVIVNVVITIFKCNEECFEIGYVFSQNPQRIVQLALMILIFQCFW